MGLREKFPETSWTLLARAREDAGFQARDDFARMYHPPVLEFLRAKVNDEDVADELTQEFFARLSAKGGVFEHADREQGPFRTYLMTSLQNFVIDYYRGPGRRLAQQTHPDQWSGGGWDVLSPPNLSPEESFHRAWVSATIAEALERVRRICARKRQTVHLALFEAHYLSKSDVTPSWSDLGEPYGMSERTARERAQTVAGHFKLALRRMLRQQVKVEGTHLIGSAMTEAAIDKEIAALLLHWR